MAKIIDKSSGIVFERPLDVAKGVKSKVQNKNTIFEDYDDNMEVNVKPFVNAVEIDWNGAQIGES